MQMFLLYLFLFIFGCMLGWVIELLFRRIFTAKKWVNPGFMKGPWLPLYGFGVILMFTMAFICISFFPDSFHFYNPLGNLFGKEGVQGPCVDDLIPILLMWVGMVLLEFLAGVIFVKGFKVKLWDYSNMKGNILGIICPVFNGIWLAVAVIYYYGVNPFLYNLSTFMHTYMFGGEGQVAHFGFIFVLGMGYGLMIYDFVVSVGLFHAISKFARNKGIVAKAEELKNGWNSFTKSRKDVVYSLLPDVVKEFIEERKSAPKKENKIKKKIDNAIYINPEIEKDKSKNYDDNGRPIKINEEEKD